MSVDTKTEPDRPVQNRRVPTRPVLPARAEAVTTIRVRPVRPTLPAQPQPQLQPQPWQARVTAGIPGKPVVPVVRTEPTATRTASASTNQPVRPASAGTPTEPVRGTQTVTCTARQPAPLPEPLPEPNQVVVLYTWVAYYLHHAASCTRTFVTGPWVRRQERAQERTQKAERAGRTREPVDVVERVQPVTATVPTEQTPAAAADTVTTSVPERPRFRQRIYRYRYTVVRTVRAWHIRVLDAVGEFIVTRRDAADARALVRAARAETRREAWAARKTTASTAVANKFTKTTAVEPATEPEPESAAAAVDGEPVYRWTTRVRHAMLLRLITLRASIRGLARRVKRRVNSWRAARTVRKTEKVLARETRRAAKTAAKQLTAAQHVSTPEPVVTTPAPVPVTKSRKPGRYTTAWATRRTWKTVITFVTLCILAVAATGVTLITNQSRIITAATVAVTVGMVVLFSPVGLWWIVTALRYGTRRVFLSVVLGFVMGALLVVLLVGVYAGLAGASLMFDVPVVNDVPVPGGIQ